MQFGRKFGEDTCSGDSMDHLHTIPVRNIECGGFVIPGVPCKQLTCLLRRSGFERLGFANTFTFVNCHFKMFGFSSVDSSKIQALLDQIEELNQSYLHLPLDVYVDVPQTKLYVHSTEMFIVDVVWAAIRSFLLQNGEDVCDVVRSELQKFGIEPMYDTPSFKHPPMFEEINNELHICVPFGSYVMRDVCDSTFSNMRILSIPYVIVMRQKVYVRPFEKFCQLDWMLFDKVSWVIGGVMDKCQNMEVKSRHGTFDNRVDSDRADVDDAQERNRCVKNRRQGHLSIDAVWNGYMGSFHLLSNNRFAVCELDEWLKRSQKEYNHFLI